MRKGDTEFGRPVQEASTRSKGFAGRLPGPPLLMPEPSKQAHTTRTRRAIGLVGWDRSGE